MTVLRGLTWSHTRGLAPLQLLARVHEDFHPGESMVWTARSLRAFGEDPLGPHLDDYDLFVFDYPFAGEALTEGWVRPMETLLDAGTLAARAADAVGPSWRSFTVDGTGDGRQAALPLDVATHVAASRPDLLDRMGAALPADWAETLALAEATGAVAMPLRPTGVWGAFLTMCGNAGAPALSGNAAFDRDVAAAALSDLVALARRVPAWCAETYPVALLGRMATEDAIAFVPLTYGYAPYSMPGYAPHPVAFHDPRIARGRAAGGAILGGAGIGVSARSPNAMAAARHAAWLTSPAVQSTLFVRAGGQPSSRAAWSDPEADRLLGGFLSATRASAEGAWLRPNRPGFHAFQNHSAGLLHDAAWGRSGTAAALEGVAEAWRALRER